MAKESKHVVKFKESHAQAGETILVWLDGYIGEMMGTGDKTQHNGVLIVTESRVCFYRKGIFGEVLETMQLKSITSVERKSMFGHRVLRLHTSHDDLEFKTFDKEGEVKAIDAIEAGRSNSEKSVSSAEADSLDKLKKLSELRDMGVLTQEEFEDKKAKLLELI